MGIEEFADLLVQTVTIEPYATKDRYGEISYGAGVDYWSRVVGKSKMIRNGQGREVVSMFTIYLQSNSTIGENDRVTLPAGYVLSQPPIIAVGRYPDEDGVHHTVVYV
jgi:hypothetical protein